ncbi:MAG: DUF3326 domain-containing protein [Candidatus Caenarcaniphilales bacterium]|nr:DUF3326 domain-containing protein [Candidatus Caenarcaniphilales bacterium]
MLIKLRTANLKKQNIEEIICEKFKSEDILRWGGISYDELNKEILVEAYPTPYPIEAKDLSRIKKKYSEKTIGAMIIPTGIACSVGGFGGDANLVTNLVSSEFDYLIVNPNVTNGGAWQNISENTLYVEGAAIDLFMKSRIGLRPVRQNKLGVIFDKNLPKDTLWKELQTVKAAEEIWGIDFLGYETTEESISPEIKVLEGGCSSGFINNPESLIKSARKIIQRGAEAIAIVTYWNEELNNLDTDYLQGSGPDPIGGIEALLSHTITKKFLIPCAHAPSFPLNIDEENLGKEIDSRVSPEITSYSFLPSVLKGLSRAPQLVEKEDVLLGDLTLHNLTSFIGPKDCWMGSSFFNALKKTKEIDCYAVQSNTSKAGIEPEILSGEFTEDLKQNLKQNVFKPQNYLELIGFLKMNKSGMKINRY